MRSVTKGIASGLALAAVAALAGCGSGSPVHPDTGYGANQPVPAPETCAAWCQRVVDCGLELCDEDHNTTTYQQEAPLVVAECQATCTDSLIQSSIPATAWTCLFTDTCREVLGQNSCQVPNASYKCN